MKRHAASVVGPPFVTFVVLVGGWELAARLLGIPAFLVPRPTAVLAAAWSERAMLGSALVTTAQGAATGFLLTLLIGTAVGVLLSSSSILERALYPYTLFLQTVPIVAVAPLLVLWFGPGLRAVAVSAFIVSVFPVIANTLAGLRRSDPRLADLFRLYGGSPLQRLLKLSLPSALPSMSTGWRVASGLAVIGALVGEFVAGFSEGSAGLGITVLAAYRQLRTDLLFAAVILAAFLGLSIFIVVSAVSASVLRRLRVNR